MEYYIFNTKEKAFNKNADIYDLYTVQPRSERVTLYCYEIFTNGIYFAMQYDYSSKYKAQGLLDGLTPETEEQIINKGYDLNTPIDD